jgi:putative nucleotidyltransferase with HDIG domain
MLVDDDEGIIDSLSAFLRRNGYDVFSVTSPVEGLEELKRNKYDLLILDYFMPVIKGDEFVSRLRQFNRDLYVILLTGHANLAPPLETIKALDIQAYCEKSPRLDQLVLLIESGIKSIKQMAEIRKFRDGLSSILLSLPEVLQLKPIDSLLDIILTRMQAIVHSSHSFILVNSLEDSENSFRGTGRYQAFNIKQIEPELYEAVERSQKTCETVVTESGIVVPLPTANAIGAAYISGKIESDTRNLLELFLNQAAISVQNATLHTMLDNKAGELTTAYSSLKTTYLETIEALRLAVDTKDIYTRGHSDRVSKYAGLIGGKMGMNEEDLETLRISGLFHDIGKIGLSEEILHKSSKLTKEEFDEIRKHPEKGVTILSSITAFNDTLEDVGNHHERIDGKGYPNHIGGNEISLGAKIISVADAFDAMVSDRQYRMRMPKDVAIQQLIDGKGTQFDNDVVACFLSIADENPQLINAILQEMN